MLSGLKKALAMLSSVLLLCGVILSSLAVTATQEKTLYYASDILKEVLDTAAVGGEWGTGVLGSVDYTGPWTPQYAADGSAFTDMVYALREGTNCYIFPGNDSTGEQMQFNWVAGSGNYAAKMIAEDGAMSLTFTAPKDGTYRLLPDAGDIQSMDWTDPAVWLFEAGDRFSIVKNGAVVWPEDGEPYTAEGKESFDLPALTFELKKGDTVRLVAQGSVSTFPVMEYTAPEEPDEEALFYTTDVLKEVLDTAAVGGEWGTGVLGSVDYTGPWTPQYAADGSAFTDMVYALREGTNCYIFPGNDSTGEQMQFNWVAGSGNYAAKMIAEDGAMSLTFTAPKDGTYRLLPDAGDIQSMDWTDPAVWLFEAGDRFSIVKNGAVVWPEDGEPYTAEGKESFDLPALTFELKKGDTVRLVAQGSVSTLPVMQYLPSAARLDYADITLNGEAGEPVEGTMTAVSSKDLPITYQVTGQPEHGTVAFRADGTFTYISEAGFNGTDSFTVQASDGAQTATATATLHIQAAPTLTYEGQNFEAQAGKTLKGTMAAQSSAGLKIHYEITDQPAHGTLVFNGDGSFAYTPQAGYAGEDNFIILASDGKRTAQATASITVRNDVYYYATEINGPILTGPAVGENWTPPLGSFVYGESHWRAQFRRNGESTFYDMTYAIKERNAYTYIFPTSALTSAQMLYNWIGPKQNLAMKLMPENGDWFALSFIAPQSGIYRLVEDLGDNGSTDPKPWFRDAGAEFAVFRNETMIWPQNGEAYTTAAAGETVDFPDMEIELRKGDQLRVASPSVMTMLPAVLLVDQLNVPPDYPGQTFLVKQDTAFEGEFPASDEGGAALTYTVKTPPAHGTLVFRGDGSFTYTPEQGYVGEDTFTITASNGTLSADGTAQLTVCEPEKPDARDYSLYVKAGGTLTYSLPDKDTYGQPLRYAIAAQPAQGSVSLTEGGKLTFTAPSAQGRQTLRYRVTNSDGLSAEAVVAIDVSPVIYDAMEGYPEAIADADPRMSGDMVSFVSLTPWQFQFRYKFVDFSAMPHLGRYGVAYACRQGIAGDGSQLFVAGGIDEPTMTITVPEGGTPVLTLNAGNQPAGLGAQGAMTFVAPKDGLYAFHGADIMRDVSLYGSSLTNNRVPVRFWVEKNGAKVWPEADYAELSAENGSLPLPSITTAMKQGDTLRFVVQGDADNGTDNAVSLRPVAVELGAYDAAADLNAEAEASPGGTDDFQWDDNWGSASQSGGNTGETGKNPGTGAGLPVAALLPAAGSLTLLAVARKRKRGPACARGRR